MNLMYSKALLSVYDKTDLLDLAKGLASAGVRLLGSGGTAKKIREAGISIEWVIVPSTLSQDYIKYLVSEMFLTSRKHRRCSEAGLKLYTLQCMEARISN